MQKKVIKRSRAAETSWEAGTGTGTGSEGSEGSEPTPRASQARRGRGYSLTGSLDTAAPCPAPASPERSAVVGNHARTHTLPRTLLALESAHASLYATHALRHGHGQFNSLRLHGQNTLAPHRGGPVIVVVVCVRPALASIRPCIVAWRQGPGPRCQLFSIVALMTERGRVAYSQLTTA